MSSLDIKGKYRHPTGGKTAKAVVLKEAGLSTSTAHRCEEIASIKEEEFEVFIEEKNYFSHCSLRYC
jgi:hypothetical protein